MKERTPKRVENEQDDPVNLDNSRAENARWPTEMTNLVICDLIKMQSRATNVC